jgi:hypothetical protein
LSKTKSTGIVCTEEKKILWKKKFSFVCGESFKGEVFYGIFSNRIFLGKLRKLFKIKRGAEGQVEGWPEGTG